MSKELDYITELERKNRLLGERCNQLLKDKGDLTDQIADIKANCDLAIEGRDIKIDELEEKNSQMFNTIALQEQQIEQLREERNYFQETCEDIELNYYCDHKGVCKAQELEKEKCELLGIIQEKDKAIKKLIADIAGLKAGRPQWHDLEKEPTDLPKDNHNVWCKALDHYGEGWYDKDTNTWTLIYRGYHLHCIEAWCEIPTFDKE